MTWMAIYVLVSLSAAEMAELPTCEPGAPFQPCATSAEGFRHVSAQESSPSREEPLPVPEPPMVIMVITGALIASGWYWGRGNKKLRESRTSGRT